jgi:hypothetical protein
MLLAPSKAREARLALEQLSDRFLSFRSSSSADPSLSSGHAGIALAHAVLESVRPGKKHDVHAARALARAGELLATETLSAGLHGGFTGIAWAMELLQGDPSTPPDEDPLTAIDEALVSYLDDPSPTWTAPYDLIEGLVGIGVYALERLPRASAKRLVALVVRRLAGCAKARRPGISWRSDAAWLPPQYRRTPHLEWNLGMAHGVPGVIALLGRIVGAEVDVGTKRRAHTLLSKAVAWVLAQELPDGLVLRGPRRRGRASRRRARRERARVGAHCGTRGSRRGRETR